ncbi:MAG: hypothetical protein AAF787_15755 [Chloroflexota bacterium]
MIAKTMAVLQPGMIDEAQVTALLNAIYADPALSGNWQTKYDAAYSQVRAVIAQLQPYQSADDDLERQFYKMFDGVQVLPFDCMDVFEEARATGGYLPASEYLVNISHVRLGILKGKKLAEWNEDHEIHVVHVPYTTEDGLKFEEADTDA